MPLNAHRLGRCYETDARAASEHQKGNLLFMGPQISKSGLRLMRRDFSGTAAVAA